MNPNILDTSVVSLIHNEDSRASLYAAAIQQGISIISFQTIAEMRFGALKRGWSAKRRQKLEDFLAGFQIIGYTDALAHRWAQVMYEAQAAGRRLEPGDAWIAATALLLNAPLLTHDNDFSAEACPSIIVISYAKSKSTT